MKKYAYDHHFEVIPKMTNKEFEIIIKNNLKRFCPEADLGYKISEGDAGKRYDNYYTNKAFLKFLSKMKNSAYHHYVQYKKGKGGELDETKGRYGLTPPKMACVTSSSRFCYLALQNGGKALGITGKAVFEVGCKIDGIDRIAPQLDACFPDENVYVEVKCQEIFTPHKPVLKEAYRNLIYGRNNQFGFPEKAKSRDLTFEIPLAEFGIKKSSSMFDIKQFLCHLMGIASQKKAHGSAALVYLFFRPVSDDEQVEKKISRLFDDLKSEISSIFSSAPIRSFTEKNNIKLMAVAERDYIMQELTCENIEILYPICEADRYE